VSVPVNENSTSLDKVIALLFGGAKAGFHTVKSCDWSKSINPFFVMVWQDDFAACLSGGALHVIKIVLILIYFVLVVGIVDDFMNPVLVIAEVPDGRASCEQEVAAGL